MKKYIPIIHRGIVQYDDDLINTSQFVRRLRLLGMNQDARELLEKLLTTQDKKTAYKNLSALMRLALARHVAANINVRLAFRDLYRILEPESGDAVLQASELPKPVQTRLMLYLSGIL